MLQSYKTLCSPIHTKHFQNDLLIFANFDVDFEAKQYETYFKIDLKDHFGAAQSSTKKRKCFPFKKDIQVFYSNFITIYHWNTFLLEQTLESCRKFNIFEMSNTCRSVRNSFFHVKTLCLQNFEMFCFKFNTAFNLRRPSFEKENNFFGIIFHDFCCLVFYIINRTVNHQSRKIVTSIILKDDSQQRETKSKLSIDQQWVKRI